MRDLRRGERRREGRNGRMSGETLERNEKLHGKEDKEYNVEKEEVKKGKRVCIILLWKVVN